MHPFASSQTYHVNDISTSSGVFGLPISAVFLIQCCKFRKFILCQSEIKNVKILSDMLRLRASWNYDDTLLRQKSKQHLRFALMIFFCKSCHLRLAEHIVSVSLPQWSIRHVCYILFIQPLTFF